MAPSQEDVLFARFRRSGDPEALAGVFDLTAPELLRVACHLVGERATGEDLVQETFLAAIDTPTRFDPGRAVLPWLLGILANLARRHRRDARRVIAAERLELRAPADPGEAAEEEEFRRALDQALAELPDAYRQVMVFHVRHGLSSSEIAAAMGRPAGTIRTYLVRGMEHLRNALPAGFAAGAAALCTPARGIAAVRAAVLSHARPLAAAASAPLVAASLLGGLFAMKKMLLAGVVLAVVAAGALVFELASPAHGDGVREGEASAITADPAEKVHRPATETAPGTTGRAVVPTDLPAAAPGSLLVRIVHAADQTTAADVGVAVTEGLYTPWDHKGFFAEGRTGEDGTVVLDGLPPGKVWVRTDRGPHASAVVRSAERGEVLVQLVEAMTLTGQVLDHEGRLRPRARIFFFDDDRSSPLGRLLGSAGPDGRFQFRGMQKRLSLWAEVPAQKASAIQSLSREAVGEVEVTLVVGPAGHRLEGRVVDPSGAPVAHAPVAIALARPSIEEQGFKGYRMLDSWDVYPLRSDAEGRFAVDWVPQGEVLLLARNPELVPKWRTLERFLVKADTVNRVELRLSDLPAVHGTLRDATGRPIAGEHIAAHWQRPWLLPRGDFFTDHGAVSAEDGTFRVPALLTGRYRLGTRIQNNSVERIVDLAAGQDLLWDPVLDRGQPATVRVVDEAGQPCIGWRVDWRQWETESWRPAHKVLSHPVSETTGEDGRAAFTGLKTGTYLLLLHAPLRLWTGQRQEFDRFPAVLHEGAQPGTGEIEVRVPRNRMPSVMLKGRVLGPEGEALPDARVSWRRVDWKSGHYVFEFPVDRATGSFEFGPLTPGTYVVSAGCEGYVSGALSPREAMPEQVLDVGDLRLRAPAFLEVTLRATGVGTGALKDARVLLGMASLEPPKDGYLQRTEGPRYRSIPLAPGAYVLFACAEGMAPARREVTVVSGQEERLELDLEPGLPCVLELQFPPGPSGNPSGVLRVRDARGATVFEEHFYGYFNDLEKRMVRRRLSLAPGRYSVEAEGEADTKCRGATTFEVSAEGLREPISVPLR